MNSDYRPGEMDAHCKQASAPDQGSSWRGLFVATAVGFCAFSAHQFWPLTHDSIFSTANSTPAVQKLSAAPVGMERLDESAPPGLAVPNSLHQSRKVGDLVLVATSPGRYSAEGTAQLAVYPRNAQTYAAGALLRNGARLEQIYPDHVVLERDGQRTALFSRGAGITDRAGTNPLLHIDTPKSAPPVASDGESAASLALKSEELTDYIRPNPVFDGDRLRGFEVYAGRQAAVFAQLGLTAGDVVVAVNGVSATDPTQIADSFQALMGGGAVEATVDRRGKLERIVLDGAVIAQARRQAQQSPASAEMNLPSFTGTGAK